MYKTGGIQKSLSDLFLTGFLMVDFGALLAYCFAEYDSIIIIKINSDIL